MTVTVAPSTLDDAYIIKNMYPLYLHDLAEYEDQLPNAHGVLENQDVRTLTQQADLQDIWWTKPKCLWPFLIRCDGHPAGFVFVAGPPHVPPSADKLLQELFVMRPFRRRGVAQTAALQVLGSFPGRWHLYVLARNYPAQQFWRTMLRGPAGLGNVEEFPGDGSWAELLGFRFVMPSHRQFQAP